MDDKIIQLHNERELRLNKKMFNIAGIRDNKTGKFYYVDYVKKWLTQIEYVCVHYDYYSMEDNNVTKDNIKSIFWEDILCNPKDYTVYEFKPILPKRLQAYNREVIYV